MFAMLVDDVFNLTDRGIVVTGYINEHKHALGKIIITDKAMSPLMSVDMSKT